MSMQKFDPVTTLRFRWVKPLVAILMLLKTSEMPTSGQHTFAVSAQREHLRKQVAIIQAAATKR